MSYDFTPLGSADDMPGDPVEVAALSRRYLNTANEIVAAADKLKRIGDGTDKDWTGTSGPAFVSKAGDLSDRVRKAQTRYEMTSRALGQFASDMEDAQYAGGQAAERARSAQLVMNANQPAPAVPSAEPEAAPGHPVPAPDPAVKAEADRRAGLYKTAHDDYGSASDAFHDAVKAYHDKGDEAGKTIRFFSDNDGLKDGWFYKHFAFLSKLLMWAAIVIVVIAVIAVIIACPAVAGFLAFGALDATALAAGAGTVVTLTELAGGAVALTTLALDGTQKAEGQDVSWATIGLDSLAVATFGLGRLFSGPRIAAALTDGTKAAENATRVATTTKVMDSYLDAILEESDPRKVQLLLNLGPDVVDGAARQAKVAVDAMLKGVKGAAEEKQVSLLLRGAMRSQESTESIQKLAALADVTPDAMRAYTRALRLSVAQGVAGSGTDVVVGHGAHQTVYADEAAEKADHTKVEADLEELQRSLAAGKP